MHFAKNQNINKDHQLKIETMQKGSNYGYKLHPQSYFSMIEPRLHQSCKKRASHSVKHYDCKAFTTSKKHVDTFWSPQIWTTANS